MKVTLVCVVTVAIQWDTLKFTKKNLVHIYYNSLRVVYYEIWNEKAEINEAFVKSAFLKIRNATSYW
jgi:hypothetical protein